MDQQNINPTQHQTERLISLVENNTGITSWKHGGAARYWVAVSRELNALGPPAYDRNEWKKIWEDYIDGLKCKLSEACVQNKEEGRHPWDLGSFTPMEKRVIEMMDLVRIMQLIPGARAIGIPTESSDHKDNKVKLPSVELTPNLVTSSVAYSQPQVEKMCSSSKTGGRKRYRSLAELQLLELKKLTSVNRKMCILKKKELIMKVRQLKLMKKRLELDRQLAQKKLELDNEIAGMKGKANDRKK